MSDTQNKQSEGLLSNVFSIAKKLATTGYHAINHTAPNSVTTLNQAPPKDQVVQGYAREKTALDDLQYENPQQMMRKHLPQMSSQLLGRHYKNINNIASFISPELNNKLSDYFFDKLNDFVSQTSSVEGLLKEVGAKNLVELTTDPARSERISQALANQNKLIAAAQGALTGATGVIGSAIDVPTSIGLALRSIYQTGRAYGFELKADDHSIVEYIFKQINLGSVAEKQALLVAVRAFSNALQAHDIGQLQHLLGSNNDAELLRKWLVSDDGSFKWSWLNQIPQVNILSKLTPAVSVGISAFYSWQLVDDSTHIAQKVFSVARQYLIQHPEQDIDALSAYIQAEKKLELSEPSLSTDSATTSKREQSENEAITAIKVDQKSQANEEKEDPTISIHQGLEDLAQIHIAEPENSLEVPQTIPSSAITNSSKKPHQEPLAALTQVDNAIKDEQKVVTKRRATRKTTKSNAKTENNSDKK